MNELPQMLSASYVSNTGTAEQFLRGGLLPDKAGQNALQQLMGNVNARPSPQQEKPMANTTRIIKIFVADADENLPLDKRLIFTGEEKLTDCTDQELFFEVPINELLTKHNDFRKTVSDKKASEKFGREVKLEPVRIRDLKMTVVTIASF